MRVKSGLSEADSGGAFCGWTGNGLGVNGPKDNLRNRRGVVTLIGGGGVFAPQGWQVVGPGALGFLDLYQ